MNDMKKTSVLNTTGPFVGEVPPGYRPLAPSTKPRWDCPGHGYGGKLSDNLAQARDAEFKVEARKRSPMFPTIAEALERRRTLRETICARFCLIACVCSFVYGLVTDDVFAWLSLTVFGLGFLATCWVAGSRRHAQMGGSNGFPGA